MTDTNPVYKPSETKREEFRKYLERTDVMDALTKVLVNLYEEIEKPDDALEFIRERLAKLAGIETYRELKEKLLEAEERIKVLELQIQGNGQIEEGDEEQAAGTEQDDTAKPSENVVDAEQNPSETDVAADSAPE